MGRGMEGGLGEGMQGWATDARSSSQNRPVQRGSPSTKCSTNQHKAFIQRAPACAVSAVTAVVQNTPAAMHALRSAWMPAPPPLSLPAIASTRGTWSSRE